MAQLKGTSNSEGHTNSALEEERHMNDSPDELEYDSNTASFDEDGDDNETVDDEDSDLDDLEEEPKLRYRRVGAGFKSLLQKDTASTVQVSDRFVVLGTHGGAVHILDFEGNVSKSYQRHSATVNDISIDAAHEFVASASDDGKVYIYAWCSPEVQHFNYRRPVKAVALDPSYARKSTKQFVSAGMAEQLIMSEKGWFGHKDTVLHQNEGPIYSIQWRGNFIAWANDSGVKIYDTVSNLRITYIDRPAESPRADLYKCRMCWKDDTTLLIGWADTVKVAVVKEKPKGSQTQGVPNYYVEIAFMFQTDYIVSGIAPFNNAFLLLAYISDEGKALLDTDADQSEKPKDTEARQPELHIMDEGGEEVSADVLPMLGYEHYQANDYTLRFLADGDMFYVMGPKDVVMARSRDQDDHIEWLLDHKLYGEALKAARDAKTQVGGAERFNVGEIGQMYLDWLVKEKRFDEAAHECKDVLGEDKTLWEYWIYKFAEVGELKAIAPFIPVKKPLLDTLVYEMALESFLASDHQALRNTIRQWPSSLYNVSTVIVAVEDSRQKDLNNETLLECLADLYTYNNQPDKAIEYNLRLRHPNAFELIQEYNMFDAVKDKVVLLMEFDQHLLKGKSGDESHNASTMPAVQLLVKNTEAIKPKNVVKQLKSYPAFLHTYLDALFNRDHHLGHEFHDLQVELYAEYDYTKLLDFLRASHYISLETAYKVCEDRDLVPEMVFILGRMGDNKKALMLIIERLGDVQRAIDFAKEQKDDDLWEDLLTYSMNKPLFIRGLLENVGTDIEPLRLIKCIPDKLEIPGLKDALLKILQDYNLQTSLHQGCEKILVSDSVFLANRMYKTQKRGIHCHQDQVCSLCDDVVFDGKWDDYPTNTVVFFCRHVYHEHCLLEKNASAMNDKLQVPSLANKVNHSALLKSTHKTGCPLCREQAAGGNAFVNRMKSQRRDIQEGGQANSTNMPSSGNPRNVGPVH